MRKFKIALTVMAFFVMAIPVAAKDGESKYATLNGAKIHYQSYGGNGKDAFVLVHGWSCDLNHWK